jgi:hypothetical protein
MAWTTDYVRKIVYQLAASSEQGRGARLTPETVDLILAALRVYRGRRVARPSDKARDGLQIEAVDELNLPLEVLAATPDENIAHAILMAAKKRFPARNIVLRGATVSRR